VTTPPEALHAEFGNIDIYVFDQLLRGRIVSGMRVMDAGCGGGRNLVYLLRHEYDVCGNDADPQAVAQVRALASHLAPQGRWDFRTEPIEQTSFPDAHADVVLASAVLHFARDHAHFAAMLDALWRVLRPGGLFCARLASTTGVEHQVHATSDGRYVLPDGTERYLVDAPTLLAHTHRLGGILLDPIKTTVVHEQRAMATWVCRRDAQ
jgi:SAM-dependent methyltransferase